MNLCLRTSRERPANYSNRSGWISRLTDTVTERGMGATTGTGRPRTRVVGMTRPRGKHRDRRHGKQYTQRRMNNQCDQVRPRRPNQLYPMQTTGSLMVQQNTQKQRPDIRSHHEEHPMQRRPLSAWSPRIVTDIPYLQLAHLLHTTCKHRHDSCSV